MFITYHGSAEDHLRASSGGIPDVAGLITRTQSRSKAIEKARSSIDIVDVAENQVVWRGIATATIDQGSEKAIRRLVARGGEENVRGLSPTASSKETLAIFLRARRALVTMTGGKSRPATRPLNAIKIRRHDLLELGA